MCERRRDAFIFSEVQVIDMRNVLADFARSALHWKEDRPSPSPSADMRRPSGRRGSGVNAFVNSPPPPGSAFLAPQHAIFRNGEAFRVLPPQKQLRARSQTTAWPPSPSPAVWSGVGAPPVSFNGTIFQPYLPARPQRIPVSPSPTTATPRQQKVSILKPSAELLPVVEEKRRQREYRGRGPPGTATTAFSPPPAPKETQPPPAAESSSPLEPASDSPHKHIEPLLNKILEVLTVLIRETVEIRKEVKKKPKQQVEDGVQTDPLILDDDGSVAFSLERIAKMDDGDILSLSDTSVQQTLTPVNRRSMETSMEKTMLCKQGYILERRTLPAKFPALRAPGDT
eukprot:Gregarina_sp_Poly_1__3449@NODE_19_length_21533_cov_161_091167_g17_i0_p9_GENE_NODE_19_length_21533_cov_161_091167_g17_i0NODE_19_length_21533_cov_161_091167_g17_i0_p9_ORF_typecomplete_len341_score70_53_NODE_19_length_21533_cov_161_091167_g17_i012012223